MKRKIVVALSAATVALLVLFIALPALATPVTVMSLQTVNSNTSEKSAQANQWDWSSWFNNDTKSFFTGHMDFNMSENFMSGVFDHRGMANVRFGLAFAKLVEFNDSNGDGYYNFNDSLDTVIKEYNLLTDVQWDHVTIMVDPFPPTPTNPLRSIQVNISGHEKTDHNFSISLNVSLYLISTSIEFNNYTVNIPAEISLKFGIHILNYVWEQHSTNYPNASRYLALVICLNGSVGGSIPHNFMLPNGTLVVENGSGAVPALEGTNGTISEIYFVDSSGTIHAKFNWFNGAYNTTADVGPGHTYFHKSGNTLNLSIAYAHDDFEDGNIIIDPYFQLFAEDYLTTILTFLVLSQMFASQAFSSLLLYAGLGIMAVVVIIGVAVVLIRRR